MKDVRFDHVYRLTREEQPRLQEKALRESSAEWKASEIPLLTRPGWILERPLDLGDVALRWEPPTGSYQTPPPVKVLPSGTTYSEAIAARQGGENLYNGVVYRPLDISVGHDDGMAITFTEGRYFDYLDSSEVLAYELAELIVGPRPRAVRRAEYRRSISNPFDLRTRSTSLGINTLTIRDAAGEGAGFFMHRREGRAMVNEVGMYHVIPAGEFAPSDISYEAISLDLDLLRNIVREYAEEFLGVPEAYGRGGKRIDFAADEPYVSIMRAYRDRTLRISVLGVALDALCLKPELLTVSVIEAGTFDRIFGQSVVTNAEGTIVSGGRGRGIPFTETEVCRYTGRAETTRSAVACISLAWAARADLGLGT